MKKVLGALISLCIILSLTGVVAQNNVRVTVNVTLLDFDQPPIIENGRTLVPMRAIFEALGCKVDYWEEAKTVFAEKSECARNKLIYRRRGIRVSRKQRGGIAGGYALSVALGILARRRAEQT